MSIPQRENSINLKHDTLILFMLALHEIFDVILFQNIKNVKRERKI